jgi:hypothetical protein
MGLYLCVFAKSNNDEEIEGLEVGSYDDFHSFRSAVADRLEGGAWGSRYPVLMSHPDSACEWSSADAARLLDQLPEIGAQFARLPPVEFSKDTWQATVADSVGLSPSSLADSFIDIDGERLIERMQDLASAAIAHNRPFSFQ